MKRPVLSVVIPTWNRVKSLELSDTQVSDLSPLQGLTTLEWLNLSRTQVTQEEINALRAALPNLDLLGYR